MGASSCLISVVDFPKEFPYLVDYMRAALKIVLEPKKGKQFQVIFTKLMWSEEQEILQIIRRIIIDIANRLDREKLDKNRYRSELAIS